MNDDNKKKLHEYFDNQGITQIQIAKDLNVTKNYINMLFTGRRYFGRKTAQRFEDLYGISYAWLMTGEGNMLKSDIIMYYHRIKQYNRLKKKVLYTHCNDK